MNSNDKTTFNIQNPGAVTQIGSELIGLENRSTETLRTDDPEQFVGFFLGFGGGFVPPLDSDTPVHLLHPLQFRVMAFALPEGIKAWAMGNPSRYKAPLCELDLKIHPRLQRILRDINRQDLTPKEATANLRSLRDNMDQAGLAVYMKSRDFKVSIKTTLAEKREASGAHSIQMSVDGKLEDEWNPPETVKFKVPLFERIPLTVELELDFSVIIREKDGDRPAQAFFRFESLNLEEDLLAARRAVLTAWMTQKRETGASLEHLIPAPNFVWGSLKVEAKDNASEVVQNRFDDIKRLQGS